VTINLQPQVPGYDPLDTPLLLSMFFTQANKKRRTGDKRTFNEMN